ncbi:chalcone isomerase family protein [Thalassotalea eurytherma]|uniref:Chalcone isomerase domain-containing protein n=1 Tax=Thalassotalea eurytherma TaxID=1144278 RepID=A0ABQ6GZK6_9GAMM|nr:chalcone isomerase family protein [Thalassotalea eurytherma]GLX81386.1 hypothetical protein theurythT_08380 [Thalassotalea eurytherma]
MKKSILLTLNRLMMTVIVAMSLFSTNSMANSGTLIENQTDLETVSGHFKDVGQAKFRVLFFNIYQSRLASESGEFDKQTAYVFEITYLRDITQSDLIERTIEQWQHLGIDERQYQAYLPKLQALWPNIKKGDQLALFVENNQAQFFYNQAFIGEVNNGTFADDFLAIWLSEKTSQPKLRQQLLGMHSNG